MFIVASRDAFKALHGESAEVYRATSGDVDEVEPGDRTDVEMFGEAKFSTSRELAGRQADLGDGTVVAMEVQPDDVLSYTDALTDFFQEGEISVIGGEREVEVLRND